MKEWYIFLFYLSSAPTTQDQTPSSAVSVATPTVSVSTPAPTATPVQTVPQPHPQTLPPAVPHSVPQPAAAIPAFPPVMVPPFRVPLPGMPIPLPGKPIDYNSLSSYVFILSVSLFSCVCCIWNLPWISPVWNVFERFMANCNIFSWVLVNVLFCLLFTCLKIRATFKATLILDNGLNGLKMVSLHVNMFYLNAVFLRDWVYEVKKSQVIIASTYWVVYCALF